MARPPRDPSLLSWPWGSSPSGSGGPSSAVGLTTLPIVNSHAESAAMLVDPMVGYWCRVGSLALTHTRTDIFGAVAIWDQRRTMLSIFVVPPTARLHQGCWLARIGRCSSRSAGRVLSLGPKSSPGALHHWFVCLQRMYACHVLYWAAVSSLGRHTKSSPRDHFDGIRVVPRVLLQLWLLAEAMFLQSLKSFGIRASLSFQDVFDSLLPSVNKSKLPLMHFVCLFFLSLGDS